MVVNLDTLLNWFLFHERFILKSRVLIYETNEEWYVKAQRYIIIGTIFLLVVETFVAFIEARTLLDYVVPACWASILCQICYLLYRLTIRPETYAELMDWVESRFTLFLHPTVQRLVRENVHDGLLEAIFMTKGIIIGFYLDYAMVIFIPAALGNYLPEAVWPKFNLPFPGHLPFYPSTSTLSCGINFAFQGYAILVLIIICGVGFSMAFTVLCFIKAQIHLINDITKSFFKRFDEDKVQKAEMSFPTYLRIIVSLHNDLLRRFESLNEILRIVCFLLEFNSCSGIFLVALVVMVEGGKKTILMGLSTTIAIALLGGFSYFSDTMKEQVSVISFS